MKKKIECFTLKLDYQRETLSKRKKKKFYKFIFNLKNCFVDFLL